MAIVVYKCNTCKRDIELQRNITGLETVGRCVITHGCRGTLYQTELYPDYVRGTIPDPVVGLDDWKQRKVLHNHLQAIERDEWVIEHNMGVVPSVSVFVNRPIQGNEDNQEEIIPSDVIAVGDNILRLLFERPWSGRAQLVSKQSDPNLLRPTTRIFEEVATPFQISNMGEVSIATKIPEAVRIDPLLDDPVVSLLVEFNTTAGGILQELYIADNQPSILSPWQGSEFSTVIIKTKTRDPFTSRSFNAITQNMTAGTVDSGSTFKFVGIDPDGGTTFRDIEKGEVLILLASEPYGIVDKIFDQYIDVTDVTDDLNQFGFYYNNGEFYATPETVTNVFPPIINVDSD